MWRYEVGAETDVGQVRELNEDAIFAGPVGAAETLLAAVADGMGGHAAGEVASRLAIETLVDTVERQSARRPGERLRQAVLAANRAVWERSAQVAVERGMGTTLTAALFVGAQLEIGHVGDSRAYLFRAGTLRQLTQDHSWVAERVSEGHLTPEEARVHPYRHVITRVLGGDPRVEVDQVSLALQHGDVALLCSDGLTADVDDQMLAARLAAGLPAGETARALVALANARGGVDNISVIVVRATFANHS
ncbi:MAG: Stp1/IreP family PP2C-type Ser/Thr phosphatase [Chloroflexi bacterium]|nr:Stp1/IreP family PP2C-type Ser/Thr phosphatase [Chloroflexota bacterium]